MAELEHLDLEVNGLRMHAAACGEGPLVVLLHGFPENWYSWRHQFAVLANAGYRVVAPDQRGYCRTEAPADVADYTMPHLVGDVVGLIEALGERQAVLVGHDLGALVAWYTAMLRPDVVSAVAGLSVAPMPLAMPSPLTMLRAMFGERFYQVYFQEPGVADAELALDRHRTFRNGFYLGSGDGVQPPLVIPEGGGFLDIAGDPPALPGWLTEADIDVYAAEFATGFTGPLNWYRNLDRNWDLMRAWRGAPITPPSAYITGELDPVGNADIVGHLAAQGFLPNLTASVTLPGVGHWTQSEKPDLLNDALLSFLKSV